VPITTMIVVLANFSTIFYMYAMAMMMIMIGIIIMCGRHDRVRPGAVVLRLGPRSLQMCDCLSRSQVALPVTKILPSRSPPLAAATASWIL
jgi:hypothetical protein